MDDLAAAAQRYGIELGYVDALGKNRTVDANDVNLLIHAFDGMPSGTRSGQPRRVVLHREGYPEPSVEGQGERLVLHAPREAFRPAFSQTGGRVWLLAVQLYAVRSRTNWGHGNFSDLKVLLGIAHKLGAAGIGLNPIHALFPDRPEDASPYSPNSRLFINPLYIDIEALPEFASQRPELGAASTAEIVDYAKVGAAKMAALREAYGAFVTSGSPDRRDAFEAFQRDAGDLLLRFASFEALRKKFNRVWWEWPEEWRKPSAAALGRLRETEVDEIGFQQYLQWNAHEQLLACTEHAKHLGLPIGLYLDMAVGVDPRGADAWAEQGSIVRGLSIGAPPDILNPAGQNWGLASFSPTALIGSDFLLLRQTLRALMRYAGAIRIDHVLGLNRFFLIPEGYDASHGSYVKFPLEAMLAVLAQESVAAHCLVIGEDLGTVPDGFRETLADWNIWSYRLMLFEHSTDQFFPPDQYPRDALVSFSTHDLPTFAGWSSEHDFGVKQALGIDPGETPEERRHWHHRLKQVLDWHRIGDGKPSFLDVTRYLARSPSGILAVSIEDALGLVEQVNVPGTIREHPNWRRRLPVAVSELEDHDGLRQIAAVLHEEGRGKPSL